MDVVGICTSHPSATSQCQTQDPSWERRVQGNLTLIWCRPKHCWLAYCWWSALLGRFTSKI